MKIYIYFKEKHPKRNKLAFTDMWEKPVDLFNHTTRASNFAPSTFASFGSFASVQSIIHCVYILSCWSYLLLQKTAFSTQSQENTTSIKYSFRSKNYRLYRDGNSANFIFVCCHEKYILRAVCQYFKLTSYLVISMSLLRLPSYVLFFFVGCFICAPDSVVLVY